MGVLIETLVRALLPLWSVWTLVAVAELAVRAQPGYVAVGPHLSLVALAAALAARSFTFGASSSAGTWLGSLPLARWRRTALQFAFGFACVWASVLLVIVVGAICGASGWLEARLLHPRIEDVPALLEALSLAFVASAYFASSFERAGAARQAALAGFFVGLLGGWVATLPAPVAVALTLAALGLGVAAVHRLQSRRGIDASSADTRLLADPRRRDRPILLATQVLFVIVPVALLVWDPVLSSAAPYLHLGGFELSAFFWLTLGLLALPLAWFDLGARGVRGGRRVGGLLLLASGVGWSLWRMLRRRGAIHACDTCGRRRVVSIAQCSRCGSTKTRLVRIQPFAYLAPKTPVAFAVVALVFVSGGGCLLGGQRYVHAYEVSTDLPGVELRLGGEQASDGLLRGWTLGPRMGVILGGWTEGDSGDFELREPVEGGFSMQALAEGMGAGEEPADLPNLGVDSTLPTVSSYIKRVFGPRTELAASYRGHPCRFVGHPQVRVHTRAFVVGSDFQFDVQCADLEASIDELLRVRESGALTPAELDAALEWGDGLFVQLTRRRQRVPARPLPGALASLWEDLIERRYLRGASDPSIVLADLERLLSWVRETKIDPPGSTFYLRSEFLPYTWAQICALGRMGESIAPRLRERIAAGDFHFVLAAGAGCVASCFDACEKLFRAQQPSASHWERLYPAWAMMRIDVERGARVLTSSWSSFDRDGRSIAARLLRLSGKPASLDWLRAQQALPDGAQDQALKDGRSVHDLGLTLDEVLFF